MRDLTEAEVKVLAEAAGIRILPEDLSLLTIRYNGWMELLQSLDTLSIIDEEQVQPIPTLLIQRGGA